jgi:hypothetical protein
MAAMNADSFAEKGDLVGKVVWDARARSCEGA